MSTLNYRKLAVFDFDGTLINTFNAEKGRVVWKEKTGMHWPYSGWWDVPDSLNSDIFQFEFIPETVEHYYREVQDSNTLLVLLTGRHVKLSEDVKRILNCYNLVFHLYYFRENGDPLSFKLNILDEILQEYSTLKSIRMYEDRIEHVPHFIDWSKKYINQKFELIYIS